MRETKNLEFKETVSNTFLKTVSSFANYGTGKIEVDALELTRLILEGQNQSYDSLTSSKNKLEFKILGEKLKSVMRVEKLTKDLLITLELYNKKEGYTIAGELLADNNDFPGIDMVRFGKDINTFLDRAEYAGISILGQYDKALEKYIQYYQYEVIEGSLRERIEKIPERAFREAVANALVHRTWDIRSNINISMFDDKIEIISPGSLPKGLTNEEYIDGQISVLRNPIIGNVFFRLGIIERFGTGIHRIFASYKDSKIKPVITVYENSIKLSLPVTESELPKLNDDEYGVYSNLVQKSLTSSEVMELTGFGKTKTVRILNSLLKGGYIEKLGNGRGTRYSVNGF